MISIYTDGSSNGAVLGPGGWGWVAVDNDSVLACGHGGEDMATNGQMELRAAVEGLRWLSTIEHGPCELVSDAQYVLGIATGAYSPSKNIELATELHMLFAKMFVHRNCRARWVKGHSGDIWNERADGLAKMGKAEVKQRLIDNRNILTSLTE